MNETDIMTFQNFYLQNFKICKIKKIYCKNISNLALYLQMVKKSAYSHKSVHCREHLSLVLAY